MDIYEIYDRVIEGVISRELERITPTPGTVFFRSFKSDTLDRHLTKDELMVAFEKDSVTILAADINTEDEETEIIFSCDKPRGVFFLDSDDDSFHLRAFVNTDKAWTKVLKSLKELHEKHKVPEKKFKKRDDIILVNFMHMDSFGGCTTFRRKIMCPLWDTIEMNYPSSGHDVHQKVKDLIDMKNPLDFGKLIFWHGNPGTGKTYAIRALLQAWDEQDVNFQYILDPKEFFSKPGYMTQAIMNHADEDCMTLFILEDSLDFLLEENRRSKGQMMSTLLNLSEGIIGQGLRVALMVTTNEEISSIDPAFIRPGRCIQNLEFTSFKGEEAAKWAENRGFDIGETKKIETLTGNAGYSMGDSEYTLAELFQLYATANENNPEILKNLAAVNTYNVSQDIIESKACTTVSACQEVDAAPRGVLTEVK